MQTDRPMSPGLFWPLVAAVAAAFTLCVVMAMAPPAHAAETPLIAAAAGSTVSTGDVNMLGNVNIRVYEPAPGYALVATLGGEVFNNEGVENSAGFAAGPGLNVQGFTFVYAWRQKSDDWQFAILATSQAWQTLFGQPQTQVNNAQTSLNDAGLERLRLAVNRVGG